MDTERPKIERSAPNEEKIPPAQDLPKPPPEPQISAEERQERQNEDEQQIREIRSSLGLEDSEVADAAYERAENFEEGVALLREKIKAHLAEKKGVIVALSGKTGSGKTTLANELRRVIAEDKLDTTVVSTDDFYLPDSEDLDLEKLHATIKKLQQGEPVGNLTPAKVILVEGLQTIKDETVGQKPDIRTYITVPANKRFAARLLRDEQVGFRSVKESLQKLTELTPETVAAIEKFEADPSLDNVDVVVNNDREGAGEPELYISGDVLTFSVPGGVTESVKVESDKVQFLEQLGIQRK